MERVALCGEETDYRLSLVKPPPALSSSSAGWSWFCSPPGVLEEVGGNVYALVTCCRAADSALRPGLQSLWVMNLGGTLDPSRGHTHLKAPRQGSASSLTCPWGTQGLVAVCLEASCPCCGHPPWSILHRDRVAAGLA